MGDVELEAPELDVDEEAGRFRRLVALGVVLITLFGATVSYAQAVESNDEDIAARDAQRDAIEGLALDHGVDRRADPEVGGQGRAGVDLRPEALDGVALGVAGGDVLVV